MMKMENLYFRFHEIHKSLGIFGRWQTAHFFLFGTKCHLKCTMRVKTRYESKFTEQVSLWYERGCIHRLNRSNIPWNRQWISGNVITILDVRRKILVWAPNPHELVSHHQQHRVEVAMFSFDHPLRYHYQVHMVDQAFASLM